MAVRGRRDPHRWNAAAPGEATPAEAVTIGPGERRELSLALSESYSGIGVRVPVFVWRAERPGPAVFLSAAVHGDEINGVGAIRSIIVDRPFDLVAGTLVMLPVVNVLGFERHSRYLPDRRDLNRCFPGNRAGNLAERLAYTFFREVVGRCDYGIDLHTAALRRTNFPHLRADLADPGLAPLARAFGAELIVDSRGPRGALRRAATRFGCPTLVFEAGEVWKVEPLIVSSALRGIRNCLIHLGMVEAAPELPELRVETQERAWLRAHRGGFLEFHVAPGDLVEKGDAIATNRSLAGNEQNLIRAPRPGIVMGMTTLPSVAPGDPVCHLAFPGGRGLRTARSALERQGAHSLGDPIRDALATSLAIREAAGAEG